MILDYCPSRIIMRAGGGCRGWWQCGADLGAGEVSTALPPPSAVASKEPGARPALLASWPLPPSSPPWWRSSVPLHHYPAPPLPPRSRARETMPALLHTLHHGSTPFPPIILPTLPCLPPPRVYGKREKSIFSEYMRR